LDEQRLEIINFASFTVYHRCKKRAEKNKKRKKRNKNKKTLDKKRSSPIHNA